MIFVLAILVIRGGPIYVSSRTERDPHTRQRVFSGLRSTQIALYGATGLPIIVAVTAVAVTVSRPLPLRCSLVIVMGSHSSRLDSYHLNGESDRRSRSEDDRGDDRERHLIH